LIRACWLAHHCSRLQVSCPRSLNFADLGSGLGKLSIAAGWLFQSSLGVENAPERAAVASSALEKLGADGEKRSLPLPLST